MKAYIMSTEERFGLNCVAARVLLNATPGLKSARDFRVCIFNHCELTETVGTK